MKGHGGAAADPQRVVEASFLAAAANAASLPAPVTVEIAFAGKSNVGKSSLLNVLMDRRSLARTSRTPGCTRQLNVFAVRCADGMTARFVDLPGYGWARRSRDERAGWQALIEEYLTHRSTLAAVVILVDVRRGAGDAERQLVDFLGASAAGGAPASSGKRPVRIVVAATKIDKLPASARAPAIAAVHKQMGLPVVGFSAMTGEGKTPLWTWLRDAALGRG